MRRISVCTLVCRNVEKNPEHCRSTSKKPRLTETIEMELFSSLRTKVGMWVSAILDQQLDDIETLSLNSFA
jgi:hypothetical protein